MNVQYCFGLWRPSQRWTKGRRRSPSPPARMMDQRFRAGTVSAILLSFPPPLCFQNFSEMLKPVAVCVLLGFQASPKRFPILRLRKPGRAEQKFVRPGPGNPCSAFQASPVFSLFVLPGSGFAAMLAPKAHGNLGGSNGSFFLLEWPVVFSCPQFTGRRCLLYDSQKGMFSIGRHQQVKGTNFQDLDPFLLAGRAR